MEFEITVDASSGRAKIMKFDEQYELMDISRAKNYLRRLTRIIDDAERMEQDLKLLQELKLREGATLENPLS